MRTEKICGTCARVYTGERDFLTNTFQWRLCSLENLWFNCTCGSTLMLPKGKFPWYSPTHGMSDTATSLFNRMASLQELPHIPAAIMELQQMLLNPEVETRELAQSVKREPFLATELIKVTANLRSIRQAPVTTKEAQNLEYAITFVGRKHLSNLVAAAALKKFQLTTKVFNQQEFWEHAFLTAAIGEILATHFYPNIPEERDKAYLAGCLSNIGKIVAALCFPQATDLVARQVSNPHSQTTWVHAEECNELASHCLLGEIGAAFWGFPGFVLDVIKFHHTPPLAHHSATNETRLCHLICLANMLAHWINLEPHRIDETRLELESQYFKLTRLQLDNLVSSIHTLVKPMSL